MKYQLKENMPILDALALLSPGSSKTSLRSWIKEGRVYVDGRLVSKNTLLLHAGQVVSLGEKKKRAEGGLQILYEDSDIVVIDKPSGVLSVATNFEKGETAHAFLKQRYKPNKVFVVHRLDQDTSGVMLFALSENAYLRLKQTFEEHDIDRTYIAIVQGVMEESSGSWSSYLYEDANYVVHSTQDPARGKLAITHFTVTGKSRKCMRLQLNLETGKKNQIRVHCRDAGHPIVGDMKYGAATNPIKRLCLHAHLLAFKHPITGKLMRFTSPVPEAFNRMVHDYA